MWSARSEELASERGLKFFVDLEGKPATFRDVLHGWRDDESFRSMFNALLANSPFSAFKWETPAVSRHTVTQPFEFVLLDSPSLVRPPAPHVFAEHFARSPEKDVLVFPNLGGDAIMIAPQQRSAASAYGHLAAFVRAAPQTQRQALWRLVGETMLERVGAKPVWLNTAGGGVSWLHVRLDERPKYYGFGPYRRTT
jgi:hypothetical protein